MPNSAERLSELIGLIYDCAIDPDAWLPTLEALRLDLGFHNAALEVYALPSVARILGVIAGAAPEFVASMSRYGSEIIALWGGPERVARYPLEEPIVSSQVVPPEVLQTSLYYREWCEPQGIFDAVAFPFIRDASTLGSVAMGRHVSAGDITETELNALRIIAPHFRRAVSINRLLNLQAVQLSTFNSTLDGLETAIVFVDGCMRVAHANTAACELLKAGDLVGLHQGELRLTDQAAGEELATAVALAVRSGAILGRRGIDVPVRRREGEPAVIHVLPLGGSASRAGLMEKAAAALFITPKRTGWEIPTDALARLYDLTPTEARIMELLAKGRNLAEAGQQIGIALSTVKSHLKQIFSKTGCQRQADLIAFANAFRPPS